MGQTWTIERSHHSRIAMRGGRSSTDVIRARGGRGAESSKSRYGPEESSGGLGHGEKGEIVTCACVNQRDSSPVLVAADMLSTEFDSRDPIPIVLEAKMDRSPSYTWRWTSVGPCFSSMPCREGNCALTSSLIGYASGFAALWALIVSLLFPKISTLAKGIRNRNCGPFILVCRYSTHR
jgi:hypothetical protein